MVFTKMVALRLHLVDKVKLIGWGIDRVLSLLGLQLDITSKGVEWKMVGLELEKDETVGTGY